ncbi:MAG: hypothetical protein ACREE0_23300 [Phenylobacterium sp.]
MAYSNQPAGEKLYDQLPAYIRERDADEGLPLKGFLALLESQADLIDQDIRQLYNDAFIETCEPWVIPYIGDLVANIPLFDESRVRDGDTAGETFKDLTGPSLKPRIALGARADVAKTIYFRRRKGTLPMLEELARDVTGWAAHAVEFFQILGWTQWLRNHIRPTAYRTPDIRSVERMDRIAWAFDEVAHTVDVRPINPLNGWYNIKNIGFFLWRLGSYGMEAVEARRVGAAASSRYHFSPLGQSAPMFTRLRREGDEAGLATELHVPGPIRPARFNLDIRAALALPLVPDFSEFYGLFDAFPGMLLAPAPSLMIFVDGAPVPLSDIRDHNLSVWDQPAGNLVSVDVARGRLSLGPGRVPARRVDVYYHYGFSADLGGGPYSRRAWLIKPAPTTLVLTVDGLGLPGTFNTIGDALNAWVLAGRPNAIVRIDDNRTYREAISIEPADNRFIAIEAADGFRPHLLLTRPLSITGVHDTATVTLSGLLVEGRVQVTGSLGRLRILHTTLVPGVSIAESDPPVPPPPLQPSIRAAGTNAAGDPLNTQLKVELAFAITGPLRLPDRIESLTALDSIIDGLGRPAISGETATTSGPPTRLERCTLRGPTLVRQINLATEVIFDGLVTVERRQVGCIRFSYVSRDSVAPRRYRCQPDLEIRRVVEAAQAASLVPLTQPQIDALALTVTGRIRPEYTSEQYGQPAYLQLHQNGPKEIATGAEDGSEQGAFCHLKQPQREANLRLRLEEYLPFGLDPGLIYVD